MIPPQPILVWRACITALHALAILCTSFRLYYRTKTRRLWWDDLLAFFGLCTDALFCVSLWAVVDPRGPFLRHETRIAFSWIASLSYPMTIWWARISLALAIARCVPPPLSMHNFAVAMAAAFSMMFIAIFIYITVQCGANTSWYNSPLVLCLPSSGLGTAFFVTDVISDPLLIVVPLHMLWKINLPKMQRYLILAGFTASIWTVMASIVCIVIALAPIGTGPARSTLMEMVTHLQASVGLISCNLLVIITCVYRFFQRNQPEESPTINRAENKTRGPRAPGLDSSDAGDSLNSTPSESGRSEPPADSSTPVERDYSLTEIETQPSEGANSHDDDTAANARRFINTV
ncbi:hypothetical protein BDN72DRAFT_457852 [Pluteus cervinus]|uniref:Uncharacterized protein n=1 Tax=Pluteus cervinus TaxID=181527 RepID=A0ACD3AZK3_9AGAR|nr:hypothetical protein BDN72DRAFT_457852 [Pluteus cervinus]